MDTQVASATIADADATTKGKIQLAGDLGGTAASPTVPGLALKAPIASPTFTGTVTSPIYASAPQTLTDAATISWNPSNGLNASVTLGGNRTLNFTTNPAVGSYGTLVITQDATGGRTITLPSTANKVLGSASTTTIALSSAANAKDILNFYYDGTNCYWNIGQGYGTAEAPIVTNLASGVSGILPVANGGTGAATLNGYVKGNGTTAMTASATIPLADVTGAAPIASPTFTGTPAAPTASAGTNTTQIATTEFVTGAIATATIPDATTSAKGKIQLAGDLGGTSAAPTVPGLALKANTSDVTTSLAAKEDASNKSNAALGTSSTLFPTQNAVKTYVDNQIASATIVDADASTKGKLQLAGDLGGTAAAPTVPGLALKAPIASPTFTGTVTSPIYASAPQALTDAATISWNPSNGLNASVTLGGNRTLNFTTTPAVGSYGTLVISQDATGGRTITLPSTSNKVLGSASTTTVALSSAANAKDILNFYYDGSNCYWNVGQGYGTAAPAEVTNLTSNVSGTLAVANGGTGATTLTGIVKGNGTTALTAAVAGTDYQAPLTLTTTGTGAATLSGTTLNIPTTTNYSLPTASASALGGVKVGTNLSIDGSGVLSTSASPNFTGSVTSPIFASTPQALTDAATISWNPSNGLNASVTLGGNRTLSFTATPTVGSYGTLVITQDATGGRTITLPSTANKVLGSTSTTTVTLSSAAGAKDILNFYYDGTNCYWNVGQGYGTAATAAVTNLASSVSGTLPVANGGTGATTLTGLVKGNGTSAMTAATAGTDYLAPTGSAANLTNFPTLNQNTTGNAANVTGIVAVANGGTGTTNGSITGTTALSFAAGGSNQNVSILPSGTGSVGIGTNSPNSSAILDASSTTKGFLPPRMTYAQKIAIASPPQGLMIYCTNCGTNGEPEYFNGVAWVNMAGGAAASVPITLGGTYGGGIVFYIFQSGEPGYVAGETHGLIAATSDTQGYRVFGCRGWPAGTSTALGTGAANTTTLLGCSETNFAAKLARAVRDGGYSDWYLPSKDELNKLYLNKNLVGNFTDWNNTYWSSSECLGWVGSTYFGDRANEAFYQNFSDGTQSWDDKNGQKGIRAIRTF